MVFCVKCGCDWVVPNDKRQGVLEKDDLFYGYTKEEVV
jgi:hypothetical protein